MHMIVIARRYSIFLESLLPKLFQRNIQLVHKNLQLF